MDLLSTAEAAERIGVSQRRIQQMIEAGELPAHRFGRYLAVEAAAVKTVADRQRRGLRRGPGRPPKTSDG